MVKPWHLIRRVVAEFIGETNFLPGQIAAINADSLDIQTPAGTIRAAKTDGNWSQSQEVWCSIRPESWRLLGQGQSAPNEFAAKLEDAMYLGQAEQLLLRLRGGREDATDEAWRRVKIAVANPDARPPSIGGEMKLGVDVEDVVVLSE